MNNDFVTIGKNDGTRENADKNCYSVTSFIRNVIGTQKFELWNRLISVYVHWADREWCCSVWSHSLQDVIGGFYTT
jgi:hypothetical protein